MFYFPAVISNNGETSHAAGRGMVGNDILKQKLEKPRQRKICHESDEEHYEGDMMEWRNKLFEYRLALYDVVCIPDELDFALGVVATHIRFRRVRNYIQP